MFFFGPKKCKHEYSVVAYDSSFHTEYKDTNRKIPHHCRWLVCQYCGKRSFDRGGAERHTGVEKVYNRWIEQNTITVSVIGEVYHKDYHLTKVDPNKWQTYEYKRVTGVDQLFALLKADSEFQELLKHQMVADAFGELETVVRMHENV